MVVLTEMEKNPAPHPSVCVWFQGVFSLKSGVNNAVKNRYTYNKEKVYLHMQWQDTHVDNATCKLIFASSVKYSAEIRPMTCI